MSSNPASTTEPLVRIRPDRGWRLIDVKELWRFRDLMWALAGRDLKVRYKQTLLGVFWVVFQSLLGAGIFTFIFGAVAKLEVEEDAPPLFLLIFAGLMAFTVFSKTMNNSAGALVGEAGLVQKVYFPRLLLPLSTVFTPLTDYVIAFAPLLLVVGLMWHVPGLSLLLLPVCLVLLCLLALGVGLVASAMAVSYRDVLYLMPFASQLLLWVSPVAYPASEVPEQYQWIYYLNPIAAIMDAVRWSLLGSPSVPWGYFTYSAVVAVVMFVFGMLAFRRMEGNFADVV